MQLSALRTPALKRVLAFLSICSLIYTPMLSAEVLALPSDDIEAPTIQHDRATDPFPIGKPVTLTATVTDNKSIKSVVLYYRVVGEKNYQVLYMLRETGSDQYSVTLEADVITEPGIEYYIEATDESGNRLLEGFAFSPLTASVVDPDAPADDSVALAGSDADIVDSSDGKESSYKWLWIGLGVLAVGAIASGSGGGGGTDPDPSGTPEPPDSSGISVVAPLPGN